MSKYIKFHKFNKYFKFILLTSIFRYLNVSLLGYNFNESFIDFSFLNFLHYCFNNKPNVDISKFKMVEFFFNYIGTLIFALLVRLYELKITEKSIDKFFELNDRYVTIHREIAQIDRNMNKKDNEIEENILCKFKNYLIINTSFLIYVIIAFIWVVEEIIMFILFNYLKDVDFWFFEILIVTIIYSKIFLLQIYKHQKFAIILNLIPSFLKITCIILTFFSDEKLIIYKKYPWWLAVGFICHSTLTSIISFINCSLKSFLDLKYTTTSQILMFYSFVGIIVSSIICMVSALAPCSTSNNEITYFNNIMCNVKDYNNYTYFDNYIFYFNTYSKEISSEKFIRSIIIILGALTFFLQKYFYLLSINYTDPVHIYFHIPIYYIFQKTILVINNAIVEHKGFQDTSNFKVAKYFLDISGDLFCFIGFLIYLEIIELNMCGLNYNLRINISKRSIKNDDIIFNLSEYDEDDDKETVEGRKTTSSARSSLRSEI